MVLKDRVNKVLELMAEQRLDNAELMARHLASAYPDEPAYGILVARVLRARQLPGDAVRVLKAIVAQHPKHAEALSYLASCKLALKQMTGAFEIAKMVALTGAPVAVNEVTLGYEAMRRNAPMDAIRHFERAIHLDKKYADAWRGRAVAAAALGNQREHAVSLRQAALLEPKDEDTWLKLMTALRPLLQPEELSVELQSALKHLPKSQRLLDLLQELRAQRGNTDVLATEVARFRAFLDAGNIAAADACIPPLVEKFSADERIRFMNYELAAAAMPGDPTKLVRDLNQHSHAFPSAWEPHALLCTLLLRDSMMRNPRQALTHAETAWKLSGQHPRAGLALLRALIAVKKQSLAAGLAQTLLKSGDLDVAELARKHLPETAPKPT